LALRERNAELVAFADGEMAQLYRQLAGSGHSIILTDRDGVLLSYCGDPSFRSAASRAGLVPGAVWSERYRGTNGMGTCLLEHRPVIVHREQHFLARNTGLTCCAAPIYDHRSELVAVLDASGEWDRAQQHTLVLVNMSAQMIENRLFLHRYRHAFVLRFHSRPELVGTWSEGIIALDASGAVLALERNAQFQLGCVQASELINGPLERVFNISLGALVACSRKQPFHPFAVYEARHGRRFFALAQLPDSARASSDAVPATHEAASLNALATAERAALLRELEREDGNISHVARNLRISRNAVYRKIHRLRIPWPIKERRH
jgi:transcriptional regulator of acetoin/glycerol metabolism